MATTLALCVSLVERPSRAMSPTVLLATSGPADPSLQRKITTELARYRVVLEPTPLPVGEVVSLERAAAQERRSAVRLALERARRLESEAAWEQCVEEAARAMSDAIDVFKYTDDRELVRALHEQAGVCMSLAGEEQGGRLHFLEAALLDETPSQPGMHREEAERVQRQAEMEVLGRPRGFVRIVTEPVGAQVWIDGRLIPGTTPLAADVRLGDHFVTIRRFRYEHNTEQRLLQPTGLVRVVLDPAQRETLRDQLVAVSDGRMQVPSPEEMTLALATWSRAEQVVTASPTSTGNKKWALGLIDVATGRTVRSGSLESTDDSAVRHSICGLLGERCSEPETKIGWYVWPLGAAALLGGILTTGILLENNRSVRFCPPAGCR